MATEFMGHEIQIGDRLFDVVDRMVTVVELYSDQILCEINSRGGRVQKSYGYNGVQSRRQIRTLYWHNPLVAEPHKDPAIWQQQKNILESNSKYFGQLFESIFKKNPAARPTNAGVTMQQATANATALTQGAAAAPPPANPQAVQQQRQAALDAAVSEAQNKIENRTGARPAAAQVGRTTAGSSGEATRRPRNAPAETSQ